MHVEYWSYQNINIDGTFGNPSLPNMGCVNTKAGLYTSGLHNLQTSSTINAGLWLSVSTGRLADGTMHGITIYFDNESEMNKFEQNRSNLLNFIVR